jgi:hypothetical protein
LHLSYLEEPILNSKTKYNSNNQNVINSLPILGMVIQNRFTVKSSSDFLVFGFDIAMHFVESANLFNKICEILP